VYTGKIMAKNTLNKLSDRELTKWVRTPKLTAPDWKGDGGGLWCRYDSNGKYWIYRFKLDGKQSNMGLGHYPTVSLAEARSLRDTYNLQKKQGINPRIERNNAKTSNLAQYDERYIFSTLFEKMMSEKAKDWSQSNAKRYQGIYENYLKKDLANKSILRLTDTELLTTLKRIKTNPVALVSGKVDLNKYPRASTLNFGKTLINLVYSYALEWEEFKGDNPLKKHPKHSLWKKPKVQGHKPVKIEDLGSYWYQIKRLPKLQDKIYMMVDLITGLRVGSLAQAKWSMFNPVKKQLSLPRELLKTDVDFVTPLPDVVVEEMVELKKMLGAKKDDYIFTDRSGEKHYNAGRPRILIKDVMGFSYATAHGNRKVLKVNASRFSNISHYAVEYQLTHDTSAKNKDENTYLDDYDWLEERVELVNWILNYLNTLEENYKKVMNLGKTNARANV
jgi:integrase